jgi:hypothetical protein
MEEGSRNLIIQIESPGVLWIPSITNEFSLSSGDNQGDYGVVRKVKIKRFYHIPSMIELVGKTPKIDDKQETRKQ